MCIYLPFVRGDQKSPLLPASLLLECPLLLEVLKLVHLVHEFVLELVLHLLYNQRHRKKEKEKEGGHRKKEKEDTQKRKRRGERRGA
jgi:hypothetical protein